MFPVEELTGKLSISFSRINRYNVIFPRADVAGTISYSKIGNYNVI